MPWRQLQRDDRWCYENRWCHDARWCYDDRIDRILETNDAGNSDTGTSDFVTRDATAVDEPDTASEVSSYESSKESIGRLPADLTGGLVGR